MTKIEAGTKNHEAFTGILGALRAVYEAEIQRLTDALRTRILAGEFSGDVTPGGDPAHGRLERELENTHPWARDAGVGRAVLAVSGWACNAHSSLMDGAVAVGMDLDSGLGQEIAECLAHDVLALAFSRRWVRGYRPLGPSYMLKVA